MMAAARAAPMPGRASSSSALALLRSIRACLCAAGASAVGAFGAGTLGGVGLLGAGTAGAGFVVGVAGLGAWARRDCREAGQHGHRAHQEDIMGNSRVDDKAAMPRQPLKPDASP